MNKFQFIYNSNNLSTQKVTNEVLKTLIDEYIKENKSKNILDIIETFKEAYNSFLKLDDKGQAIVTNAIANHIEEDIR